MNKSPDCVINPKTKRAVKKKSKIGKKIMEETSKPLHDCVINPKTGRAVKKTSKLGKKIIEEMNKNLPKTLTPPPPQQRTRTRTRTPYATPPTTPPQPTPPPLQQTPQEFSIVEEEIYVPPPPPPPNISSQSLTSPEGRIKTLKQFGHTCWFNSLIMSMFYSDASRALLLSKYEEWNVDNKIYNTFRNILLNQYLKKETDNIEYNMFNAIRPENVLNDLYKYNNKIFNFDPKRKDGYFTELYVRKLYEFFGVKVAFLELYIPSNYDIRNTLAGYNNLKPSLIYSPFNYITEEELMNYQLNFPILPKKAILEELDKEFDVVIVRDVNFPESALRLPSYYEVPKNHKLYAFLKEPSENITIDNVKFKMDTMGITSVKLKDVQAHAICGITAKGEKSVYNGWTRQYTEDNKDNSGKRNIPCELMRYDWDFKKDERFRLGKDCKLTFEDNYDKKTDVDKLQFSFGRSAQSRLFYYVKEVPKKKKIPKATPEQAPVSNKSSSSIYIKDDDSGTKYNLENRLKKYKIAKRYLDQISETECIKNVKIGNKSLMTLSNILYMDKRIGTASQYGAIYLSTIKGIPDLYVVSKLTDKKEDNLTEIILMEQITNEIVKPKKSKHFPLLYTSHLCEDRDDRGSLVSVNELCNGDLKMLMNNLSVLNIKEEDLLNMLFQIFIAFGTFTETIGYYHNDGHWGNILYQNNTEEGYYEYKYENFTFYLKSCPYNMMLYDFGLSREKDDETDMKCIHDFYRIANAFIPADTLRGWNMFLKPTTKSVIKISKIKEKILDIIGFHNPYNLLEILQIIIAECPDTLYKTKLNRDDVKLNNTPFIIKK